MTRKRPATIEEYIEAAPPQGQHQLHRLHALLRSVAPGAEEAIKWGTPFFVEPRFLFAFSAHKAHLSFSPQAEAMKRFEKELAAHQTTKYTLKVPYTESLPEDLIRRMAEYCLHVVSKREDAGFW